VTLVPWIPHAQLVPLGDGALSASPVHRSDAGEEVRQAGGLLSLLEQVKWSRPGGGAYTEILNLKRRESASNFDLFPLASPACCGSAFFRLGWSSRRISVFLMVRLDCNTATRPASSGAEGWTPRQGRPRVTLVPWIPQSQLVPLSDGALPYSPVHRSDAGEGLFCSILRNSLPGNIADLFL